MGHHDNVDALLKGQSVRMFLDYNANARKSVHFLKIQAKWLLSRSPFQTFDGLLHFPTMTIGGGGFRDKNRRHSAAGLIRSASRSGID